MVTLVPLKGHCICFPIFFSTHLLCGDGTKIHFKSLFQVVTNRNLSISIILGSSSTFSWNLNFYRNLIVLQIKDLEKLMTSLTHTHLSPFIPYPRVWELSFSGLFSVKSYFFIQFNILDLVFFHLAKFLWKSKAPSKVKAFTWLVAHKKVNDNDMLQLRRPFKALNSSWNIPCSVGSGQTINHLFLHCLMTLGLWYKLFKQAKWIRLSLGVFVTC